MPWQHCSIALSVWFLTQCSCVFGSTIVDSMLSGAFPFGRSTCVLSASPSCSSSVVQGTSHFYLPLALSWRLHRGLVCGLFPVFAIANLNDFATSSPIGS